MRVRYTGTEPVRIAVRGRESTVAPEQILDGREAYALWRKLPDRVEVLSHNRSYARYLNREMRTG